MSRHSGTTPVAVGCLLDVLFLLLVAFALAVALSQPSGGAAPTEGAPIVYDAGAGSE